MKAAVVHAFDKPLSVEEVDKPKPGPGEIIVKMEASGLCHTDIHAAKGDWPVKPSLPFIPGHEGIGIVESVGEHVSEVKEGDRVGLALACLRLRGLRTLCKRLGNSLSETAEYGLCNQWELL